VSRADKIGLAKTWGFMRRRDYDHQGVAEAWEHPDGRIFRWRPGDLPLCKGGVPLNATEIGAGQREGGIPRMDSGTGTPPPGSPPI